VGENQFGGYVSTKDVDRDNEVILPDAFNKSIKQYLKNPIVLAAHMRIGANGEPTIIAKATSLKADDYGLRFIAEYAPTDLAGEWKKLIEGGFVSGVSHRFIPKNWEDSRTKDGAFIRTYSEVELMEISVEPLHSNRGALIDAKGKGFDLAFIDSLIKGIDERDIYEKQVRRASEKTMMALGVIGKEIDELNASIAGLVGREELETMLFKVLGDVLDPDGAYAERLSNPESMGHPDHEKQGSDDGDSIKSIEESLSAIAEKINTIGKK
jgi:HK97 family phage prohead protease